jgi:carbon starvation protein CstA
MFVCSSLYRYDLIYFICYWLYAYQVEEIVVPALAHVVGPGITVDCGIMYVPNGWWKQVGYVLRPDGLLDFVLDSAV